MLLAQLLNCSLVIPPRVIACRLGVGATAEPTYQDTVRYITLVRPLVLPADFLSCLPSHQRPSFSEFQDLTSNGRLHTTDDGKYRPLLVRQIISPPVWLAATGGARGSFIEGRACSHLRAAAHALLGYTELLPFDGCPRGATPALQVLERFFVDICIRWWLRNCLKCQARKTSRLTVRWPIILMSPLEGHGVAVNVSATSALPHLAISYSSGTVSVAAVTCVRSKKVINTSCTLLNLALHGPLQLPRSYVC